jgi:hypothetical protein
MSARGSVYLIPGATVMSSLQKSLMQRLLIASCLSLGLASIGTASGTLSVGDAPNLNYSLGKQVFQRKLACDGCQFHNRGNSAEDAKKLLGELSSVQSLTTAEKAAVMAYLKRRYKLS